MYVYAPVKQLAIKSSNYAQSLISPLTMHSHLSVPTYGRINIEKIYACIHKWLRIGMVPVHSGHCLRPLMQHWDTFSSFFSCHFLFSER